MDVPLRQEAFGCGICHEIQNPEAIILHLKGFPNRQIC